MYDIEFVRKNFSFFENSQNCVYLDNAATTLKPKCVIQTLAEAYTHYFGSIGRGTYDLVKNSYDMFCMSEEYISDFFGASGKYEMIITSGATEGVNIVAKYFEKISNEKKGIGVSLLEHHSNFLPWKAACQKCNAPFITIPFSQETGQIELDDLKKVPLDNVELVAITHASNVTGIIQPLDGIISYLHGKGIKVFIDGAQSSAHMKINLDKLSPDFFVCSAHKILGPMGVGILFVKKEFIDEMIPFKLGGGMVNDAENMIWKNGVDRFMAGTVNSVGLMAFASALKFIDDIGFTDINIHMQKLIKMLEELLDQNDLIIRYGPKKSDQNLGIISFNVKGMHAHDVGAWLNAQKISVRVGHHCAQPLIHSFGIEACVRSSLYLYNNEQDIIALVNALKAIVVL